MGWTIFHIGEGVLVEVLVVGGAGGLVKHYVQESQRDDNLKY